MSRTPTIPNTGRTPLRLGTSDEAAALATALRDWMSYKGGSRAQLNFEERQLRDAAYAAIQRLRASPTS